METSTLLLGIVKSVPSKRVEGRKRLQKYVHLLKLSGSKVPAEFYLLHYGPFSDQVASAAEELSFMGTLNERIEPIGIYRTYQYVYELGVPEKEIQDLEPLDNKLIQKLDSFSTVALEVASTIGWYEVNGFAKQAALERAKRLKPQKTIPSTVEEAERILEVVGKTKESRGRAKRSERI